MFMGYRLSFDSLRSMFKKRDGAEIIADILKAVGESSKGKRKTNIMQSANLSYDQVNKYLDLLLRNGYVILDDGFVYKPTGRGLRFLENLQAEYLKMRNRL